MEYEQIPAMNGSTIIHAAHSMRRLRRAMDGELEKKSQAMGLGSMVHCLVLEPEQFDNRYCTMPKFEEDAENVTAKGKPSKSKSTDYYKQAKETFLATEQRTVVSSYDLALAHRVAANIKNKRSAQRWISGTAEKSFWGNIAGVDYKGRIDCYGSDWICDIKTCSEFGRDGRKFFYGSHGLKDLLYVERMAGYRELFRQQFGKKPQVKIVAAETTGDLDVAVITIPDVVLNGGYQNLCRLLTRYKHCLETGEWPGIDEGQDELLLHQGIVNAYMPDDDDLRFKDDPVEEVEQEEEQSAEMPF